MEYVKKDDSDTIFVPDNAVTQPIKRTLPKWGRNWLCSCGSGLKYKKCCLNRDTNFDLLINSKD